MNNVILDTITELVLAGSVRPVYAYANFLTILENTASNSISIGLGDLMPVPLRVGLQIELPQGDSFSKLLLKNESAADTIVTLILSNNPVRDNRLTLSGEIPVKSVSNSIVSGVAIVVGIALPATARAPVFPATVREVHYCNSGQFEIWYGDSNVSPASNRGIPITPGQVFVLPSTSRPFFVAKDGASVISYNYFALV